MNSHMEVIIVSWQEMSLGQFPAFVRLLREERRENAYLASLIVPEGYSNEDEALWVSTFVFWFKEHWVARLKEVLLAQGLVSIEYFRTVW